MQHHFDNEWIHHDSPCGWITFNWTNQKMKIYQSLHGMKLNWIDRWSRVPYILVAYQENGWPQPVDNLQVYIEGLATFSFPLPFLTTPFSGRPTSRVSILSVFRYNFEISSETLSIFPFVCQFSPLCPLPPPYPILISSIVQSLPQNLIPNDQSTLTDAIMFKRSHRSNDRVEKNIKLKKSYKDAAKLSKLQKSFDQSLSIARYGRIGWYGNIIVYLY